MGTAEKGEQNQGKAADPDGAEGASAEDGDTGAKCNFTRRFVVDPARGTLADLRDNRVVQLGVEGALAGPNAAIGLGRNIGHKLVGAEAAPVPETAESIDAPEV